MGGFHAAPSFLSMTGSKDDGLKELKMQLRLVLSFLSELERSERWIHENKKHFDCKAVLQNTKIDSYKLSQNPKKFK